MVPIGTDLLLFGSRTNVLSRKCFCVTTELIRSGHFYLTSSIQYRYLFYIRSCRAQVDRAINVRIVEAWEGSELFFGKIIELMDVYFVKHKQLTVLPYPFKYLREWCYLNELLDEEDDSDTNSSEEVEEDE